jgi:hypothetical protein
MLQTALSDPAGTWTISVRDRITGISAEATVEVAAPLSTQRAPGFAPWGWPSEIEERAQLSSERFVECLRKLNRLYTTDQSGQGWMTKQRLGYYYDLFPDTRHALLRPLQDIDWREHVAAIRRAVESGETFVLTGEDVNVHPGSGLATYPHADGQHLAAVHAALDGAAWTLATRDGETIAASLGKGRVLLCRESIDAAGHDSPSISRWQQRWLSELKGGAEPPLAIAPPTFDTLVLWWMGRRAICADPRVVTWFGDNHRQVKLKLDPRQPLGEVFTLTLPPTGHVEQVQFGFATTDTSGLAFDVGCDGSVETEVSTSAERGVSRLDSATDSWAQTLARCLEASSHRDSNGWRVVPVRVTSTASTEVILSELKMVVRGGA